MAAVGGSRTPWTEHETTSVEPVKWTQTMSYMCVRVCACVWICVWVCVFVGVCVCMCYVYTNGYTLHQPSASPAGIIPSGSTGFTGFSGDSASSWALRTIAWHISATEPSPPTHTTLKNRYKIVTHHIMSVFIYLFIYFILPTRLNSFVSTTSSRGCNFSTGPIRKVSITNKSFLIVAATNCMYQNSKTLIQYLDEYSDKA